MSSTRPSEIFALVDCNSFYCSCERVFNPRLNNKPVVVLSNNDGCIVSLTKEAKAVGLQMGAPIFQSRDLVRKYGVEVFSSNYTLYGDMSARVMKTLAEFTPELEIYSIDEAFLSMRGFATKNLCDYGQEIRETVMRYTGIPVSIGIGPTKVLAKAANKIAKKSQSGVFDLSQLEVQDAELSQFPVRDIWGIGSQSEKKLHAIGIRTAKDLRDANEKTIQKVLTIVGRRILKELKGESCLSLEMIQKDKKEIISSRSFGKPVFDLYSLSEAVSNHVTRACEKLRFQASAAHAIQVFVHTNPFKEVPQYFNMTTLRLLSGEDATNRLITVALSGLGEIYRDGFEYKKCGIVLLDLRPKSLTQLNLFDGETSVRNDSVMKALDKVNRTMGTDALKFASCGTHKHWQMRSESHSRCFTTCWRDILIAGDEANLCDQPLNDRVEYFSPIVSRGINKK